MAITTLLKENWKEDKEKLQNTISSLKKERADFKEERKSKWKLFKNKFHEDMDQVEKSLKDLKALRKKKKQ